VWRSSWCDRSAYPSYRGVNVFVVDAFRCSVRELRQFDTYASSSAAARLSSYLQLANDGAVVVGVTADEVTAQLAGALPALLLLGVDASDVRYRGSFAFVAQKSFPSKTVVSKVLDEAASRTNPAQLNATVTGKQ